MELEKLKSTWASIESRLSEQSLLQTSVLKEILKNKSESRLGRIINYGYFALIVILICDVVYVWSLSYGWGNRKIVPLPMLIGYYSIIPLVLYYSVATIISLRKLLKINFSAPMNETLQRICDYRKFYNKQLLIVLAAVSVLIVLMVISYLFFLKPNLWTWLIFAGTIGICSVLSWWEYKRMYRKNMDIIQQSVEEMKELDSRHAK
jgi:Flp pilus assembly protein TadB